MKKKAIKPPFYYRLAIWLASPIYRLLVYKKSRHLATYPQEVATRFGRAYPPCPKAPVVWCHAVSLGELNTAYPLLKLLLEHGYSLWITSTTQTGYARAKMLFEHEIEQETVQHSFVPIDRVDVVRRFLSHTRPVFVLFVETELWANTLHELRRQKIPAMMVNARLTQKSYQGYANFPSLSASMMRNLNKIIAQDEPSALRFIELMRLDNDIDKVVVADSLKWASAPKLPYTKKHELLSQKSTLNRPIWVAASTHAGEEEMALAAHQAILKTLPDALLILVPRHPERFDEVYQLCQAFSHKGFSVARRSKHETLDQTVQVYLADTMGELMNWYVLSDVAFVGGSLVDKGGHTPIEPASVGTPIVMGQYTKNADVLVSELTKACALTVVADGDGLMTAVQAWLGDRQAAEQAGRAGQQLVHQKSGAAVEQFELVMQCMDKERASNESEVDRERK